jgi:hypothetical protein
MNGKLLVEVPRIAAAAGLAVMTLTSTVRAALPLTALASTPISRVFVDQGAPKVHLLNGREFLLLNLPDGIQQQLLNDIGKPPVAVPLPSFPFPIFPGTVDNRQYQGPIRDQGGRGTCVSFSTTAAVEGRYRRANAAQYASLDLSEQWANHLQKMVSLSKTLQPAAADREDQVGAWGGSSDNYLLRVLQKYGEPQESVMPYNSSGGYGPATDPSDPDITRQRTTDNFNLDPNVLPLSALETAHYRPTAVTDLTYSQIRDPAYVETLVALGDDVVFDISLASSGHLNSDYAWTPDDGATPGGGHSMLIVGYNHAKQYFIVRNSWGYDSSCHESGYVRLSYGYLQKFAYMGAFVSAVADPNSDGDRSRLYIGRWSMNHDGWPGTLDIYRLPGLFQSSELNGQTDDRIGTYFAAWNGQAYRVNGYVSGRQLVFFIDFNDPNAPYGSLGGTRYTADLFSWDDQNMAGLELQDGQTYSFMASKLPFPVHVAAKSPATFRDAHLGHWKMEHDGWQGDLYLSAGGSASGITGSYVDQDGQSHAVLGSISGRNFQFQIWFGSSWQAFSGYLYSWDKGLMSGITWWNGQEFGFQAFRQPDVIRIPIHGPLPVVVLQ